MTPERSGCCDAVPPSTPPADDPVFASTTSRSGSMRPAFASGWIARIAAVAMQPGPETGMLDAVVFAIQGAIFQPEVGAEVDDLPGADEELGHPPHGPAVRHR